MKGNAVFWLLGMGSSGSSGSVPPLAPELMGAFGTPGGVLIQWDPPVDDGGSPITGFPIEQSTDQQTWTQVAVAEPSVVTASINNLTAGTRYYFRVYAQSLAGKSDPSNVLSAVPTKDYNSATGGVETQYVKNGKSFKVHTFKADEPFVVSKAVNPFRVLAVGGGSGGGTGQPYCKVGDRGASGEAIDNQAVNLSAGSFPVTVGGAGAGSSVASVSARGAANTGRISSDITGVEATYPGAGGPDGPCRSDGTQRGGDGTFPGGEGGGGGGIGNESPFQPGPGGSGAPGLVVISYEIAPFNDCSGGSVTEFEQDGKRWRTHTFTSATDTFVVNAAPKPFRVLAVGAGFNGATGDYGQYGGGGGGVTDKANLTFTVGNHPVEIGMPSGGTTRLKSPTGSELVVAEGAKGGNGVPGPGGGAGGPNNGGGGNGTQSDITGAATWYAGGGGSVDWNYCCPARGGEGGLGGGGAWDCGRQHASYYGGGGGRVQHTCSENGRGFQGILIVRYEIEPK